MSSSDELEPPKKPKSDTNLNSSTPKTNQSPSNLLSTATTDHSTKAQQNQPTATPSSTTNSNFSSSRNTPTNFNSLPGTCLRMGEFGGLNVNGVGSSYRSVNGGMSKTISLNGKVVVPSSANSSSDMSMYSYPEMRFAEEWIKLNVGGTVLISTRNTLTKYSQDNNHFLAALVNNHTEMNSFQDETGAYLIDRSPEFFKYVIDFLRTGRLELPNDNLLEGVLAEAEFCNLQSLIKLCVAKIDKRDIEAERSRMLMNGSSGHKKVVYRTFQSSNVELTTLISTLSDTWHLEQIIALNNDKTNSHNSSGGAEFLVVVSMTMPEQVGDLNGSNGFSNNNCNDKVKALSGSMSSQTIRNLYSRN